jgi:hypothetical protein
MRSSLAAIGFLLFSFNVLAQDEDCEQTLSRALQEFQSGHFYSIPSILSPCVDKFTLEQQQRASMLLTQTYLLLDDPIGAKRSYLDVLKANPEFVADPNIHSIDVVYLSKKFTARPLFSWFGKAGTNVTPIRVIQRNDLFGNDRFKDSYKMQPGYNAAVGGEIYPLDHIVFRAELSYLYATYQRKLWGYFASNVDNGENPPLLLGDRTTVSERQSWINAPVTVMYEDDRGKYRPYGYAGYAPGFLLRDMANITIEDIRNSEGGKDEKESPALNFITKRNRFNQSIVVGGGVKMKFGLQFLFVDVRYNIGLRNIVNTNNRLADYTLDPEGEPFANSSSAAFSYAYADDYFRVDNLSISFGFLQPLYKPREVKKARTKSVLKNINSEEK